MVRFQYTFRANQPASQPARASDSQPQPASASASASSRLTLNLRPMISVYATVPNTYPPRFSSSGACTPINPAGCAAMWLQRKSVQLLPESSNFGKNNTFCALLLDCLLVVCLFRSFPLLVFAASFVVCVCVCLPASVGVCISACLYCLCVCLWSAVCVCMCVCVLS